MRLGPSAAEREATGAQSPSHVPQHVDSGLSGAQRAYYRAFLVALVICFSPFKAAAYAAPLIVTALILLPGGGRNGRLTALVLVVTVMAAVYSLTAPEFLLDTYLLAIITHSSVLPIVLVEGRLIASRELVNRLASAASWALLIEGVWGITQAIYGVSQTGSFGGANGDYVEGTIHPSLSAELAFGNPMFATNIVFLLLLCIAQQGVAKRRWPFLAAGTLALVLASVVHVLVYMIGATVLAILLVYTRRARRRAKRASTTLLVAGALGIAALSHVALDATVSRVTTYAEAALDTETLMMPRSVMLYRVFADLPASAPLQPWIGLGPGQFCSRASLIASGLYLGDPENPRPIPFVTPQSTQLAADYCIDLHVMASELNGIGSTHQPFFSLLTVYTEVGLAGLLLFLLAILRVLANARRRAAIAPEHRPVLVVVATGVLFMVFLGLQQTYWEIPQAILVGCLVVKALHAMTMHDDEPRPPSVSINKRTEPRANEPQL